MSGTREDHKLSELAEYEKTNSKLVSEANVILHDYGLLELLSEYGKPVVQGSYSLNLMTWRDLDIHLEIDKPTVEGFFRLGMEIATKLKPRRMSLRNELASDNPDIPRGLYWGIYTKLAFPEMWKIDIFAMNSKQFAYNAKRSEDLKAKITEENRPTILRIKTYFCIPSVSKMIDPRYRRRYCSMDIYRSVLEDKVRSVEDFSKWLDRNKGVVVK